MSHIENAIIHDSCSIYLWLLLETNNTLPQNRAPGRPKGAVRQNSLIHLQMRLRDKSLMLSIPVTASVDLWCHSAIRLLFLCCHFYPLQLQWGGGGVNHRISLSWTIIFFRKRRSCPGSLPSVSLEAIDFRLWIGKNLTKLLFLAIIFFQIYIC